MLFAIFAIGFCVGMATMSITDNIPYTPSKEFVTKWSTPVNEYGHNPFGPPDLVQYRTNNITGLIERHSINY